ncbi:MAG TPA: biotin/lipoyl-binding protein [Pirellulales bacterium]|nr:biotin/lipoyl-binding protein [Pirellulales bacterium]
MRWLMLVSISAAVAALAFLAWGGLRDVPSEASAAAETDGPDESVAVGPAPCLFADGVVEAAHRELALRFETPGRIKAVYVREGQSVKAGDVLAELESDMTEIQVAEARTRLTIASAERDQMLANAGQLARARPRSQLAAPEAPLSPEEKAIADGKVSLAEAEVRRALLLADRGRLVAPTDGLVLRAVAEPGEFTGPTDDRDLFVIVNGAASQVRAFVEELDGLLVSPGQRALVTAAASPGKRHRGTVRTCSPYFRLKSQRNLRPGERVDVRVREVVVDLEAGHDLLLGLPVEVLLEPPSSRVANRSQ